MMQQVEEQFDDNEELHVVGCKDDDEIQMQIMMKKGKRTKRRRQSLSSPLRLSISISSDHNSAGTTSSNIDHQELLFINKKSHFKEEEEEDMANCLILLAQDHKSTPMAAATAPNSELPGMRYDFDFLGNNKKVGSSSSGLKLYLYECKTCNRYFPSYQALGGHRVSSHKKLPKPNHTTQQNKAVTTFANNNNNNNIYDPTNTDLTLQLSSSSSTSSSNSSKRSRTTMTSTNSSSVAKSKVHECSICGTQFASGQALGGHMRRHRDNNNYKSSLSVISNGSPPQQPKNVLKLDLNLPAPEDDNRDSNFPFETKEKVRVFSAASLVDCHY